MDSGGLDPQIQISRPPDPEIWTLGTPEMTYFGPFLDPFGVHYGPSQVMQLRYWSYTPR